MDKNKTELVFLNAAGAWGIDAQVGMLYEELGELMSAINKFKRGRITHKELAGEIADCRIMIKQAPMLFGIQEDLVDGIEDQKMERLAQRLNMEF